MQLREYIPEKDFEYIGNWIDDERVHAMWCAGRFAFPLEKDNFADALSDMKDKWGDTAFLAVTDDGDPAGFFCYSLNNDNKEGMLKFIVVNPAFRGKGIAKEMLKAASDYAFENGAELVHLNVFSENARAKKCYLNSGFCERSFADNAFRYKDELWGRYNMVLKKDYCEKKYPTVDEIIFVEPSLEISVMTYGHPLWENTISFAEKCSWKAGTYLAKMMRNKELSNIERVIVATEGDAIIGYCTFAMRDELPDDAEYTPFIGFVFVDEGSRGKRVSERMINAASEYAGSIGYERIYIMSGEQGLYEKYGFVKIGDFKTRYGTEDQLFQKSL